MARYIFIDSFTGYIFGDSADIDGRIVAGTPAEVAAVLDASIGEQEREYELLSRNPRTTDTGYDVYRADVNGSEAVPIVIDGQDRETINAVIAGCEYVGFLAARV